MILLIWFSLDWNEYGIVFDRERPWIIINCCFIWKLSKKNKNERSTAENL